MDTIDVIIEDTRWESCDLETLTERAVGATLVHLGLDPDITELSLLACDDVRIAVLNADFRDRPTPTNVLSWPAEERAAMSDGDIPPLPELGLDGLIELGDIAISYDTCAAEAASADKLMGDHVTHLIVHGVLHLLGYDHISDKDAALMEGTEVKILGKLGLDDPYRVNQA